MRSRQLSRVIPVGSPRSLCNDSAHDTGRAAIAFSAWPAIIATGLFVLVTHYVGVAAGAPLEFLAIDTSLALLFLVAGAIAWQRRPT